MAARKHIEEIRRTKFSIRGEPNPLTEDLHQAVKNLSAELYAKDVHFLMELIQNAEDNEYPEGVEPSLEFVITSKDITGTGASATLLLFNNERGFSPNNIDSICSVGRSTKKGLRKRGYIGEKGIGFKSVFLITAQPYIFSNGYQIRFSEKPCLECNVGYIVPEWVESPALSVIQSIYGTASALPTTTVILPLKLDKVKPVKEQLSSLHPEVLLFLSKIRRLSVREDNEDPRLNTVSAISISTEINFVTRKNVDAESYMLHLAADESGDKGDKECGYHMWRQRFPVKQENRVDVRMEVEEWVITLAFPNGKRLNRGRGSPGIYAFLPTETVTNFPFIIQADFLLASSRENILWDNKWNQGILDCVPFAFLDAFTTLVKSTEGAPVSSLPRMFWFLPVGESSHPKLNNVRNLIKQNLMAETIVPCESYMDQRIFRKPCEVGRLNPQFWSVLRNAKSLGVSLSNISSHGSYILSHSFDRSVYNSILDFLGVGSVDDEWYSKCIQSSNLVMGVSDEYYIKLLQFIAGEWSSTFQKTSMKDIPLLKYIGLNDNVSLCSISEVSQAGCKKALLSAKNCHMSWLVNWSRLIIDSNDCFFLELSQEVTEQSRLSSWLRDEVKVIYVDVFEYAKVLIDGLTNRRRVVSYAHLLYHSLAKDFLLRHQVETLCSSMPLVDNYGTVTKHWRRVLVPANGSRWVQLIGSNPWKQEGYIELGEDYLCPLSYAGIVTSNKELIEFLKTYVSASDVPDLSPANAAIPTLSAPLTKENVFLLLTWIRTLRIKGEHLPEYFLSSIKDRSWLKISLRDSPGYRPPSQSFMLSLSQGRLFQNRSVPFDIPLIDTSFYGDEINEYKEELRMLGVMFEDREACQFIGKHLMSLANSRSVTCTNFYSILKFIKLLRENCVPPEEFVNSIRSGEWMRTSLGDKSPGQSVLFGPEWNAASQISDIPFIDEGYYGKEVMSFKTELELLGVIVCFGENYEFVVNNLKSPSYLTSLTGQAVLLILDCIQKLCSPAKLAKVLKELKCLKTNLGYRRPSECFLFDPECEWGSLLQVFSSSFPLIDEKFYGSSIFSFKNELKQIGIIVDFEQAAKKFAHTFREMALLSSINRENVLSFLNCYKKLKKAKLKFPPELKKCIRDVKWLRTRLNDYRSPSECILFSADWYSISKISSLPFLDDSENCLGKEIQEYKQELRSMGVVTDLKGGADFVAAGLDLPRNPEEIAPESVYSLLRFIRILLKKEEEFPESFNKKITQSWLKTCAGYSYRPPENCLLFSAGWKPYLKINDGPFIDELFYGSDIRSFKKELCALGVTVDFKKGCQLVANHPVLHSDFSTICRIYAYLCAFEYETENEDSIRIWIPGVDGYGRWVSPKNCVMKGLNDRSYTLNVCKRIWIPGGDGNGEWVSPEDCVLYDQNNLFGLQLNVLKKYYDEKLLSFFSKVLRVKVHPSIDDYCKLWKVWEESGRPLSHVECCSFWEYVVNNWNLKTEEFFAKNFLKVPVNSNSDGNGISLFNKDDVFIADDLYYKELFEHASSRPLFVWYPQSSMKALPRTKLLEVFSKIGVRNLSESVQYRQHVFDEIELKLVNPKEMFIKRGLFKLILGFLADPEVNIESEGRHKAASRLLEISVFETLDPIAVEYRLSLTSGDKINVNSSQMIRWERENSKVIIKKLDRSSGPKNVIEYASHFSEVIAEGVLWDYEDLVEELGELIRLGFLVEFDEAAVDFLMQKKNLQIFLEDEEFLSTKFPST